MARKKLQSVDSVSKNKSVPIAEKTTRKKIFFNVFLSLFTITVFFGNVFIGTKHFLKSRTDFIKSNGIKSEWMKTEIIEKPVISDIKLNYTGKSWLINSKDLSGWVNYFFPGRSVVVGKSIPPLNKIETKPSIYLHPIHISNYLAGVGKEVNIEPQDAKLEFKNGKVSVFALSRDGQVLDTTETINDITKAIENNAREVSVVVAVRKSLVSENSYTNLGLRELIASGTSTYAGSPNNRRKNIAVGAEKFNGILIKPDEVFSFNQNLGPVEAYTGFLPELVIVEDGTVPQYGGGLCQVSTTMFRAALNAGLPIVARRRHSYPVKYYAPYGTDATIYPPNPDMKFKNDTGHHILIQVRQEKNKLTFDFYGTKPSRTVKFSGTNDGGKVTNIETVSPRIWDKGVRGPGSLSAEFYRFIYDSSGKLIGKDNFVSKYESPEKYPKRAE